MIVLFILFISVFTVDAQNYRRINMVKINSFAMLFKNTSLFYERAVMPRISASAGLSYKYKSKPPGLYFEDNYASIRLKLDEIHGYSITPEMRYYIKSCETEYPSGFYSGIYFRYTHYKSDMEIEYTDDAGKESFYSSTGKMDELGLGIQLGYQLHITNWLLLDFLIIGPRFSWYHVSMAFDDNINELFIIDAEKYIQNFVDQFGMSFDVDLSTVNIRNLKSKFEFFNWRYGLSIGIAF